MSLGSVSGRVTLLQHLVRGVGTPYYSQHYSESRPGNCAILNSSPHFIIGIEKHFPKGDWPTFDCCWPCHKIRLPHPSRFSKGEHHGREHQQDKLANRLIETFGPDASMAKATDVGRLIVPGYFLPLLHAHPTFGGLTERLKITDGIMELNPEAQPNIADRSLRVAHNCLIEALKVQDKHFHIEELEAALQTCL